MRSKTVLGAFLAIVCLSSLVVCAKRPSYDVVILNGRIMDPLTRTDVVANIGIQEGKISVIVPAGQMLAGESVIDAAGLVVTPGFINIHGHEGVMDKTMEVSVRDGVTTMIGGNCGGAAEKENEILRVGQYFDELEQSSMYSNFATFAGHSSLRYSVGVPDVHTSATKEQTAQMIELLDQDMKAGALGISYGPFYHPGTTYEEMMATAKKCAEYGGGSSIHIRHSMPLRPKPADEPLSIQALREGIRLGKESGLPMIISHFGGPHFGPVQTGMALQVMYTALEEGVKLISDIHPYDAFNTGISAPIWGATSMKTQLQMFGLKISDVAVQNSVTINDKPFMEALEPFSSFQQFERVRNLALEGEIPDPGIIGKFYPSQMTLTWMQAPFVMIENDGFVSFDRATEKYTAHPRIAGTFSKFLGYWVREKGVCDLMTGLSKCSTMAAVWLGLKDKGRIKVGADADLVLFDPLSVIDKATYRPEECLLPPEGIPHVIVNGVLVVENGELTGQKPGQVIRRTWKMPGILVNHGILPAKSIEQLH